MARRDGVHVDQTTQALRHSLHNRASDSRGSRGTGLTGGQQENRHAAPDSHFHDLTGFRRELHGRNHKGNGQRHKRTRAPGFFRSSHHVQQFEAFSHVVRVHKGRTDVLLGA